MRGSIVGLVWDDEDDPDGNVQHIARHGITPWEVRQALRDARVFIESDEVDGPNPVYVAVGPTASGKLLEVWGIHFQSPPMQGFWRTITAVPARSFFREQYRRAEKKEGDCGGGSDPEDRGARGGDRPSR